MLIIIEGIDGSGKATQTRLLVEHLQQAKYNVGTLDFPGYQRNFFGKMVRRYLDGEFGPPTSVNPYLASVLYALDRWESSKQIQEWMDTGHAIVLDRYVYSNLIHQTANLPSSQQADFRRWDIAMEFEILGLPKPDLTIFLHLPVQVAFQLIQQRSRVPDGLEREQTHLEAAERQCSTLAKTFGWQTIECTRDGVLLPPIEIHAEIWNAVRERFNLPPDVH